MLNNNLLIVFFILGLFITHPVYLEEAVSADLAKAPKWETEHWINLPSGKQFIEVTDFRGKVIYLSFFQKW